MISKCAQGNAPEDKSVHPVKRFVSKRYFSAVVSSGPIDLPSCAACRASQQCHRTSCEAAQECSPCRKAWEKESRKVSSEGAKETCD